MKKKGYIKAIVKEIFPRKYEDISYKQKEILKLNLLARERNGELTVDEQEQLEEYVNNHKTEQEKQRRKNVLEIKQSLDGMKITADDKHAMKNKLSGELKNQSKKNKEDLKELMKEIDKL